ncbi:MAG: hypothetical protein Kow0092_25400 [Deferrisomatales bacterium]
MKAYRKVDDQVEIRVDTGRLALLGVGAGLVLILVFLLGVLVGRSLWGGRRLPAPVAGVTAPAPGEGVAPDAPPGAAPAGDGSPGEAPSGEAAPEERPRQYTFYEDLKKPDRPSGAGSTSVPAPAAAPEPPHRTPAAEPTAAPAKAPPSEAPVGERPAPEAAQEPAPKLPAPVFTVQVGSFRDRGAAEELLRRMEGQGVPTVVVRAQVAGRSWHRVQVGEFRTRAEAEAYYRKRLRPRGIQGFVTTR